MNYQTKVIHDHLEAQLLLSKLKAHKGVVAVDTETEGHNIKEEPAAGGTGRIVCWSLAYRIGESIYGYFIPADYLGLFATWLKSPEFPKVGHNIFSYDLHFFRKAGTPISGIVGDSLRMAKLSWNHPEARYGLKDLAKSLYGLDLKDFRTLFTRRTPGKVVKRDTCRESKRQICGEKVPTLLGLEYQELYASREFIPLSQILTEDCWKEKRQELYTYGTMDAIVALMLYETFSDQLREQAWTPGKTLLDFYDEIWNLSLYCLVEAETNGFTLDVVQCGLAADYLKDEAARLEKEILSACGEEINWNSPKQVSNFLYSVLGLPASPVTGTPKAVKRARRGEYSTSEVALLWLADNTEATWLTKVVDYKKTLKLIQRFEKLPTFVDALGRVHYQLTPSTDTGRLAAANPPIQQIPKKEVTRRVFVAAPGHKLITVDYSQLEIYILAHFLCTLYDDQALAEDLKSLDFHQATADRLGISREMAKAVNYSVNYGKTAKGLAAQLGITPEDAEELLDMYYRAYPSIQRWQIYCESFALKHGYIRTLLGRKRYIPEIKEQAYQGSGYRKAINTPIQGSAADLVTMAMLRTNTRDEPQLKAAGYYHEGLAALEVKFLCQVHDELIFEVPESNAELALPQIIHAMESPLFTPLAVPTPVDATIKENWWS